MVQNKKGLQCSTHLSGDYRGYCPRPCPAVSVCHETCLTTIEDNGGVLSIRTNSPVGTPQPAYCATAMKSAAPASTSGSVWVPPESWAPPPLRLGPRLVGAFLGARFRRSLSRTRHSGWRMGRKVGSPAQLTPSCSWSVPTVTGGDSVMVFDARQRVREVGFRHQN